MRSQSHNEIMSYTVVWNSWYGYDQNEVMNYGEVMNYDEVMNYNEVMNYGDKLWWGHNYNEVIIMMMS